MKKGKEVRDDQVARNRDCSSVGGQHCDKLHQKRLGGGVAVGQELLRRRNVARR